MTEESRTEFEAGARPSRGDQRTPVMILSGFLGSGKTSLLNSALADPQMSRTMVVINEFGEISIDHELTAKSDDIITVLDNGCLCCTVFGDLVGLLQRLYHDREAGRIDAFDRIVIETSGLANPVPVMQAFLSDPALAGLYRFEGLVVTVDAVNGASTFARHVEAIQQVAVADTIVVTKGDLVGGSGSDEWKHLLSAIRQINPAGRISDRNASDFDAATILRHGSSDPTYGGRATLEWLNVEAHLSACGTECDDPTHDHMPLPHHAHSANISTHCLVREKPSSREALNLLLTAIEQNLGPSLLRVKGIVGIEEQPEAPAVIQGAQHLLHNVAFLPSWPSEDRRTRIVFIVQNIPAQVLEEMVTLLDRVAVRTAAAKERGRTQSG